MEAKRITFAEPAQYWRKESLAGITNLRTTTVNLSDGKPAEVQFVVNETGAEVLRVVGPKTRIPINPSATLRAEIERAVMGIIGNK